MIIDKELRHQLLVVAEDTEALLESYKGRDISTQTLISELAVIGWKYNRIASHLEDMPFVYKTLLFSTKVDPKLRLIINLRRGRLYGYNMYYSSLPPAVAAISYPLAGMRTIAGRKYKR